MFSWDGEGQPRFFNRICRKEGIAKCTYTDKTGIGGGSIRIGRHGVRGADSVLRVGPKGLWVMQILRFIYGTQYRIIYDIKVLERTDWYAYTSDTSVYSPAL